MKSVLSLSKNDLQGKRVFLRLDLNVPVLDGVVTDDFRIISALPTLQFLKDNEAKITVVAHCEANKGEDCSLKAATDKLGAHFPVIMVSNIDEAKKLQENGEEKIIVIENLRQYSGEKENDPEFAKELATLGDIYVNEAFSVSHRAHASIVGVPKILPSYAGIQLEREVLALSKSFNPPHPFVFILGGAKFDTKLPLIQKFLDKADTVFIGGALANDLLKAKGIDIKNSLVSKELPDLSLVSSSSKLIPVTDMVWNDKEMIVDIGKETMKVVEEKVRDAAFVLWNGPLGYTEGGFEQATVSLAQAIAQSDAESILGGGDTLAAIKSLGIEDHFSFISTGGGATLDFLANETLPGIEALD